MSVKVCRHIDRRQSAHLNYTDEKQKPKLYSILLEATNLSMSPSHWLAWWIASCHARIIFSTNIQERNNFLYDSSPFPIMSRYGKLCNLFSGRCWGRNKLKWLTLALEVCLSPIAGWFRLFCNWIRKKKIDSINIESRRSNESKIAANQNPEREKEKGKKIENP